MERESANTLQACTYEEVTQNCKVFNRSALEYHLWIKLDPEITRDCAFLGAEEIGPHADNSKLYPDTFVLMSPTWIRANMEYLDLKIGQHIIKLSFVNRMTDDDFSLYVSYIIQDDKPNKPYVYMPETKPEPEDHRVFPPAGQFTLYEG